MLKTYNNRFNNGKPNPNTWTEDGKKYLKANYHLLPIEELVEYFGKDKTKIKNQADRQYLNKK
jgi:hypothetical protein